MDWYLKAFKNFGKMSGRARRKEYWLFILFNFITYLVLVPVSFMLGFDLLLPLLYLVVSLVPSFTVAVRRLHDIGFSGWWMLLALIPGVGALVLLGFSTMNSQQGANKYGENPKLAMF